MHSNLNAPLREKRYIHKYLGFPVYAYNNTPQSLPVNLSILNLVLYPLGPTLLPNGINDFFLSNRVDILVTKKKKTFLP